jgi:nitroreductase
MTDMRNPIFERVSVRKFTDAPVSENDVEKLMRAAMAAPSAGNQQPWEFYVVTDHETRKQLSIASPYAGCAADAPLVIVPCQRVSEDLRLPECTEIDVANSCENILLEATACDLGAVWLGIAPVAERVEAVAKALDLPKSLSAFALIACGHPAESKTAQSRYDASRVHRVG